MISRTHSRYERFDTHDLTLRDELAIDRTLLANERTLLAYLRSGVALVIAGVSIVYFGQAGWFQGVGLALLPVGIGAGLVGLVRYVRMIKSVALLRRKARANAGAGRG